LSGTVTFERLQAIAWQCRQISKGGRGVKPVKAHLSLSRKARELLNSLTGSKPLRSLIPVAYDHGMHDSGIYALRKL
jgi:hypothetical protein